MLSSETTSSSLPPSVRLDLQAAGVGVSHLAVAAQCARSSANCGGCAVISPTSAAFTSKVFVWPSELS